MQLILSKGLLIGVEETDTITGGAITVNGKTYDDIEAVKYEGELPKNIVPEKYMFADGEIIENPDYLADDVVTRLNDVDRILIDLLDSI